MLMPNRVCDLVMKGGIASGILYPAAVRAIAEKFAFVSIGGTSAGAMAACLTAAAEYRRRHGDPDGFDELAAVGESFRTKGQLLKLFAPDRSTRKLHSRVLKILRTSQKESRTWLDNVRQWTRMVPFVIRTSSTLGPMVNNNYGLCSGMANDDAITPWLDRMIRRLAGHELDRPLTFGDLRSAPIPTFLDGQRTLLESRSIDFRAVTTCITFGRPYELPDLPKRFAFKPEEMRRLFPDAVVDWMIERGNERGGNEALLRTDGLVPFPVGDDMPVVVAARMSLSFPGFFSMIPLYAVDYEDPAPKLRRVWFSDGGITSNFPIHRFDSLFPLWPTIGINLQYHRKEDQPMRRGARDTKFFLPALPGPPQNLWSVLLDEPGAKPMKRLTAFAGGIFRSAQVWHDNAYLELPGFRDRVVEIWLNDSTEGGLNLDMSPKTVQELLDRGAAAGASVRDRFADGRSDEQMSWDGHRWTRYRSAMAGMMDFLRAFRTHVDMPVGRDRTLDDLLGRNQDLVYRFDPPSQGNEAKDATDDLLGFVDSLTDGPFRGGPNPTVEFGTRARIDGTR